jgi:hypothetical protein
MIKQHGTEEMKKKDDHDEKTCFRCRLHALFEEIYPKGIGNDERFILTTLAEAVGQLLSGMDDREAAYFMFAVMKFMQEDEEDETPTEH